MKHHLLAYAPPAVIALGFPVSGCSKDNTVNAGDNVTVMAVGQQCNGNEDQGCGVDAVCALGYCRHGCTNDAECPRGSLCVGDQPPYGCTLPSELACSSSQPCTHPLACGLDGKCRWPCERTEDCPRNEHVCIAGTCVSNSDPDERWFECDELDTTCGNASPLGDDPPYERIDICHAGTIGWSPLGDCVGVGDCMYSVSSSGDLLGASCEVTNPGCVEGPLTLVPGTCEAAFSVNIGEGTIELFFEDSALPADGTETGWSRLEIAFQGDTAELGAELCEAYLREPRRYSFKVCN